MKNKYLRTKFFHMINYIIYPYSQVQNYWPKREIFTISFKTSPIIYFNLVPIITPSKMRKLTVRKADRTPKNAGKTPVTLNSKSDANPSKKHGRNDATVQSKHPSKSRVPDESEVTSEDEQLSKPVKDIFLETYTLYKSVMLDDIMIIGDTDFLKYKEFDYRQFETQVIRKLDKVVSDDKRGFEYISGSALISAKKVPVRDSMLITLEDNFCWTKVERGIERWMLENKKEITVKLTILYKKTGESDSESSDDDRPSKKKVFVSVHS
jgi:hypothetical protein